MSFVVPLALVLSIYRPTDMLGDAPPDLKDPALLWPYVWNDIERNHEALDSIYWTRFKASVTKRQREPIRLSMVDGQVCVANGHHRIWALVKAGKTSVRAKWNESSSPTPCVKGKPCAKCPWVSRDARDVAALTPQVKEAAGKGHVFTCHVNLGVCHGADAYAKRALVNQKRNAFTD